MMIPVINRDFFYYSSKVDTILIAYFPGLSKILLNLNKVSEYTAAQNALALENN